MAQTNTPSEFPTFLQRVRGWFQSLAARLRAGTAKLRALRGRGAAIAGGTAAAVLTALIFAGVPRGPDAQVERAAVSGKDLFAALLGEHPGVLRSSRVDEGEQRGTGTNLVVLPQAVWDGLSVAQRNALGSWLNTVGGRWEIRVGVGSEDGQRVLDAQAVITSREWNQQMR